MSTSGAVWPEGWSEIDNHGFPGCTVLQHARYGYVTLDWDRRVWSVGMGTPRPRRSWEPEFTGRNWRQTLARTAVEQATALWEGDSAASLGEPQQTQDGKK